MEYTTEELKIKSMKQKIRELIAKNENYIGIIKNIIEYERTHIDNGDGWTMDEITGLNGGYLAQLLQQGIIVQGYYSQKYHQYMLAENENVVFQALDEIEGEREEVALIGKKKEESPIITAEDVETYKNILKEHDAIDYWYKFVAPAVCGHDRVKKAILIQIASPDDTKNSRGRMHILLEGEPGTGKSMFRE
ncbi:MAG: hypothetical protein ACTSPB_20895, partial [Candidatus Thorarchaeota archaeon]